MKRLNLKLLVSLVVGTSVMGAGVWLVHGFQLQNSSAGFKAEGDSLLQEGKKEEALKKYIAYLKQNDSDDKVQLQASKLAMDLINSAQTPEAYREAIGLAFDQLNRAFRQSQDSQHENQESQKEIRALMAEFYMKIAIGSRENRKLFNDAIQHLEWLTKAERGGHDTKYDLMLAACYRDLDFVPKAMNVYATLSGYDQETGKFDSKHATAAKEMDPYIFMAKLLREREPRKPKEADAIMERLVQVNPDSATAHLARASYLLQYQERDEQKKADRKQLARDELAQAEKISADDPQVIVFGAILARDDKDYAKAEKILLRGLKIYPKNVAMYRQWAIVNVDQKKSDEARKKIDEGLKILPDDIELLWLLVEVQLQQQNLDGARATVKKLAALKYPPTFLDLVDARITFYERKWLEAAKKFEALHPLLANSPEHVKQADIFMAQSYGQLGAYDKQLEAARRVLQVDKLNVEALEAEAFALKGLGKTKESDEKYIALWKLVGGDNAKVLPQVWVPIVEGQIANVLKQPPESRDWSKVDQIIAFMAKDNPKGDVSIALVKAEVQFRKNDLDGAYKTLDESRAANPKDPAIWSALATIVLTQKDKGAPAALKLLDQVPEELRGNVTLKLNRIGMLVAQGGGNLKTTIAAEDKGSEKLSQPERLRLWAGIGTALLSIGDREGAIRFWTKVTDADKTDLRTRFTLFDVARETGDDKVMQSIRADMQSIMGKTSVEAKYVDAARTVALIQKALRERAAATHQQAEMAGDERKALDDVRNKLKEAEQARPGWQEIAKVSGDLELLDGNVDGAITKYKQALNEGPTNPATLKKLVMLIARQRDRSQDLKEIIDRVGTDTFNELQLGRFLPEAKMFDKDFDGAIQLAEKQVDPKDPYSQMWFGHLCDRAATAETTKAEDRKKYFEKAEAAYRQATKAGASLPETWLVLIDHLMARKQNKEASAVLMEARKELPEDRVNQVLAPGYEALGETLLAEQYYHAALEASPKDMATHRLVATFYLRNNRVDDARREAALVLSGSQGDPQNDAKNRPHLLWARRALADILADQGDLDSFNKARALLSENIKINKDDPEDKIRLASLLARRFDEPAMLRESLRTFEGIKNLGPEEQVTVAKIHEVLGDFPLAREELLKLVTQRNAPVAAHLAFADMLIRNNQIADAANRLDEMDRIYPDAGLLLRTQVLVKQGRPNDAIALLGRILPPHPVPKEKAGMLRTVALLMDRVGLDGEAEKLYREYMEVEPGVGALQLAALLGRAGRLDDALDLCEGAFKTQPKGMVFQFVGEVLHGKPARIEPRHLDRVKGWFDTYRREDPENASLLLQYADFQVMARHEAEAEKLYRDVLKRSDVTTTQKAIASNNLAFVLATQRKDLPEALALINAAGGGLGFTSDLLDTRGLVYAAMGKFPEAAADFRDCVLVTYPSAVKLLHLAYAEDRLGDREQARKALQRAKDAKLESAVLSANEKAFYDQLVKDVGF